MSRNRSMKTKKQRHGQRKSKQSGSFAAKPVSPVSSAPDAEPAKPVNPTPPPPEATQTPPPSLAHLRRAAHRDRKLKAKVRLLEKEVLRLRGYEKHLARAHDQLAAARTQIDKLNTAMEYLLSQAPHNGQYFNKDYGLLVRVGPLSQDESVR